MAPLRLALADGEDRRRVLLVGAMGEVEPRHVHARLDQLAEHGGLPAGRADRAHDSRPSHLNTFLSTCPV